MTEDQAIERLRDAIRRQGEMPTQALIDSMVKRGVIAPDGTVLIHMLIGPRPSEEAASSKGTSRAPSSRKKRKG